MMQAMEAEAFVMGIGRNFNFDHAILPDPLPSFVAVRGFFHRLSARTLRFESMRLVPIHSHANIH